MMKNLLLSMLFVCSFCFLVSCINSATTWSNRSVTYQAAHELLGESAYVSESPHANDTSLEASKSLDTKSNIAGTGALTDNSSNTQNETKEAEPVKEEEKKESEPTEEKAEEVPIEENTSENTSENTDDLNK